MRPVGTLVSLFVATLVALPARASADTHAAARGCLDAVLREGRHTEGDPLVVLQGGRRPVRPVTRRAARLGARPANARRWQDDDLAFPGFAERVRDLVKQ